MNGEDLIDSMEYVDAQWVEEAENPAPVKRKRWIPVVSVAACLAIVLGSVLLWPSAPSKSPQYEEIHLSAEQVAAIFNPGEIAGETNQYEVVTLIKGQQLKIYPLPTEETAVIYNQNESLSSEEELEEWTAPILKRMCESLGISVPSSEWSNPEYWWHSGQIAYGQRHIFTIERSLRAELDNGQFELRLDGELIVIDQTQTDEQIIASLESIKQKLFVIFDTSFPDAKVVRNKLGVTVFWYDKGAHPLNALGSRPVTDYIELHFDNIEEWEGDIVSADELINAEIEYWDYQMDPDKHYEVIGYSNLISLEEAEELLDKGYVFGGNGCSECMSHQTMVDFSDYDYVSYTYAHGYDIECKNLVVPFYAFYKQIGQLDDGGLKYAKTYVCAVEVSGLEQYFEKKAEEHHKE